MSDVLSKSLSGSVIVEKVRAMVPVTRGFNAETDEYVDMMEAGINDPTKTERIALRKAASIASLLLKTEALITDLPDYATATAHTASTYPPEETALTRRQELEQSRR